MIDVESIGLQICEGDGDSLSLLDAVHIRAHKEQLMELTRSKVEEFHLLGYELVTAEDLWAFVCAKVAPEIPLHQLVDFILSVRVMDFMNYQTISSYKTVAP